MTVLVVGASGFIGRPVAADLAAAGLTVLGTSTDGAGADLACDLTRPDSVERALREARPDTILIAAGQAAVGAAWRDPDAAFRVNTAGPFNLLDSARRLTPGAHLVFISSAAVYGPPATTAALPFTENSPLNPGSPYAASKAAAEVLCHQFTRQAGLAITIVRVFNQLGPGQPASQAPAEFALAIARAEKQGADRVLLPVGNPAAERDFTDRRDTARALTGLVANRVTGTFNLCSGTATDLRAIVTGLATHTGLEVEIEVVPERAHPADVSSIYGSNEKLGRATGWRPEITLGRSLADLLDDCRNRV